MKLLTTLLGISGLVVAIVASPVLAQNDDMPADDPMIVLEETLDDLDDMITFDLGPTVWWSDEPCEDEGECEGMDMQAPHHRSFRYRFGPDMGHRPKLDFHGDFSRLVRSHRDPALRSMEKGARDLARKARRAEGSEKARLEKQLDEKLNAIFDYKVDQGKKAIENAEQRLARLKERQSKRKSARDEIIRNRKNELLGTERYLEW